MQDYNNKCEKDPSTKECEDMFNTVTAQVGVIYQQLKHKKNFYAKRNISQLRADPSQLQADLDPDDLYHDFCTGLASLHPDLDKDPKDCKTIGQLQAEWLSREDVQKAIHA